MEHLSNGHKDHPNQHENSHMLCDEMGHPVLKALFILKIFKLFSSLFSYAEKRLD